MREAPLSISVWLRQYSSGLRRERLRVQAVALATGLWLTAAWTLATPGLFDRNGVLKGVDFLQFYTAAWIVAQGDAARLYDWQFFSDRLQSLVPGTGDLLFFSVYPPQLALLLAPLGRMPYAWALVAWSLVSLLVYAATVRLIARQFPELRGKALPWRLLALAFVPFQQLLMHGQVGVLVLACVAGAWVALRHDRWWTAGALLGTLCFKPPFAVAVAAVVVSTGNGRLALGALAGAAAQGTLVMFTLGPGIITGYVEKAVVVLRNPEVFEPKPWQLHSLKGFWQLLLGSHRLSFALWVVCSLAVLGALAYLWRRTRSADLRAGALVLAVVLVNPHLYVYDLVVLAVVMAALVRWTMDAERTAVHGQVFALLHLAWWVPLVGPLAVLTRIQLTSIVLLALLAVLVAEVRAPVAPAPATAGPRVV